LGLSTFFPDDRTDPGKSAKASAQLLRRLHTQFGDWPLALAAYNTGGGRVSRLLAARHATTFAGIADSLPGETRLYVPKVLALVKLREGVDLDGPAATPDTEGK
jgi:membrane-bound lytic murein transglycosylase D